MSRFARNFGAAFRSIWAQIGVLLSAIALLNFVQRLFSITLSELITQAIEAFRAVFHPLLELVLGWLSLNLSDLWLDAATLYLILGGAVARTVLSLASSLAITNAGYVGGPIDLILPPPAVRMFGIPFWIALWPAALILLCLKPYVERTTCEPHHVLERPLVTVLDPVAQTVNGRPDYFPQRRFYAVSFRKPTLDLYDRDLRTVFILQLAASIAVAAFLAAFSLTGIR